MALSLGSPLTVSSLSLKLLPEKAQDHQYNWPLALTNTNTWQYVPPPIYWIYYKRAYNCHCVFLTTQKCLSQGPESHSFEIESSGRIRPLSPLSVGGQNTNFSNCQLTNTVGLITLNTDQPFAFFHFSDSAKPPLSALPPSTFKYPITSVHIVMELSSFPNSQ